MSRNSYTASERRGVLAIAILALLIIAGGVGLAFYNNSRGNNGKTGPVVVEHPEFIDSTRLEFEPLAVPEKNKKGHKSPSSKPGKQKIVPRRRSPLDEPVSL